MRRSIPQHPQSSKDAADVADLEKGNDCRGIGRNYEVSMEIQNEDKQASIETVLNLSDLQVRILLWLYEATVYIEEKLGYIYPFGTHWTFSQDENLGEYSDQAISRALHRLENRGLLIRNNHLRGQIRSFCSDPPPSRTTSVRLTAIGREVAELIDRIKEVTS